MHISKGYKTTYDWSKLLASYAKVKKTKVGLIKRRKTKVVLFRKFETHSICFWVLVILLEVFLITIGLTKFSPLKRFRHCHCLSILIMLFFQYDEVVDLVSRNRLFSVDTKNPNFVLHPKRIDIDQQTQEFFDAIHNYKITFDSVIIDPPKNQGLENSMNFLSNFSYSYDESVQ